MKKLTQSFKVVLPDLLRIAFLTVLCGLMIAPAIGGEFLQWDDDKNLYKNNWLLDGQVGMFWTQKYYFLLYIPLTYTIWTGLWHLWGDPLTFHLFSLALHIANCNWVYLIVKRLFPRLKTSGAWLVMIAFAVMPLQVEAFAWISGGRDVMALQFALFAVYLFIRAESRWTLVASAVVFALGLLCKPTIAPLPVALLMFFPFRSLMRRRHWLTLGAWLLLAIVDLAWNRWVQDIGMDAKVLYPLPERLLLCLDILGFYISKIVFPWPLNADYARTPWKVLGQDLYLYMIPIVATATVVFVYIQKKLRIASWEYVFFFLIGMSPVLGVIPFMAQAQSSVADRYVYWPWIGLAILLVLVAQKFRYGYHALTILFCLWTGVSFARSFAWTSDEILFTDMVTKSPDSFTANNALGAFAFQDHNFDIAEMRFKKALELMPHRAGVASNLIQLYWQNNKHDRIIPEFEPLLTNNQWLSENNAEYIPVSVIYLVVARQQREERKYEASNMNYCRAFAINPDNFSAKLEIMRAFEQIKEATGKVVDCIPK